MFLGRPVGGLGLDLHTNHMPPFLSVCVHVHVCSGKEFQEGWWVEVGCCCLRRFVCFLTAGPRMVVFGLDSTGRGEVGGEGVWLVIKLFHALQQHFLPVMAGCVMS